MTDETAQSHPNSARSTNTAGKVTKYIVIP